MWSRANSRILSPDLKCRFYVGVEIALPVRGTRVTPAIRLFDHPMALTIRSIGQTRANARMTMANLSYNFRRLIFHERRQTAA